MNLNLAKLKPSRKFDVDDTLLQHRQVFLYGEIDDDLAYEVNRKLLSLDITELTKKNKKPITLWINSNGGDCDAGLAIVNTMLKIKSPVITIINNQAASMAAIISIVGDTRFAFSTSIWMQHPMSAYSSDYYSFMKDRAKYLDDLNNILLKIVKDNTKLTKEELHKLEHGELWLTNQALISKGIVDKLI